MTYPQVNLGTSGHQYEILPVAPYAFNLDVDYVVLLSNYYDPNVHYDTPEYLAETHDAGDQSVGGFNYPVHVSGERVGQNGVSGLEIPYGGRFVGGNAPYFSYLPAAYWQQINGIDATQWYTDDSACPS